MEKADILELTVNHLTKLHSPKDPVLEAKKFQAGFGQCAAEACRFIMAVPDLDANVSQNLISHLSRLITAQPLTIQVPERPPFSPPTSPSSLVSDRQHYYSDHERSSSDAEDSVYSGDGSKHWAYSRPHAVATYKHATPGLLTTVDKLSPHAIEQTNGPVSGQRNAYFNRVPAEAKDLILQKIRQHIMDKRGNETIHDNVNNVELADSKYLQRTEAYRGDYTYQYSPVNGGLIGVNNDTLDLRKVRSPVKSSDNVQPPKTPITHETNQPEVLTSNESKAEVFILPEQCEFPMDYSNLPPKKKRKLIEYQEYKKQEAARRKLEGFCAEKKERHCEGPPADEDTNKWRPW